MNKWEYIVSTYDPIRMPLVVGTVEAEDIDDAASRVMEDLAISIHVNPQPDGTEKLEMSAPKFFQDTRIRITINVVPLTVSSREQLPSVLVNKLSEEKDG